MRVIAGLLRKTEISRKSRARFQFNAVSTFRRIDRRLQIVAGMNRDYFAGARCLRQRTLHMNTGQLRRAVKLPLLCESQARCNQQ